MPEETNQMARKGGRPKKLKTRGIGVPSPEANKQSASSSHVNPTAHSQPIVKQGKGRQPHQDQNISSPSQMSSVQTVIPQHGTPQTNMESSSVNRNDGGSSTLQPLRDSIYASQTAAPVHHYPSNTISHTPSIADHPGFMTPYWRPEATWNPYQYADSTFYPPYSAFNQAGNMSANFWTHGEVSQMSYRLNNIERHLSLSNEASHANNMKISQSIDRVEREVSQVKQLTMYNVPQLRREVLMIQARSEKIDEDNSIEISSIKSPRTEKEKLESALKNPNLFRIVAGASLPEGLTVVQSYVREAQQLEKMANALREREHIGGAAYISEAEDAEALAAKVRRLARDAGANDSGLPVPGSKEDWEHFKAVAFEQLSRLVLGKKEEAETEYKAIEPPENEEPESPKKVEGIVQPPEAKGHGLVVRAAAAPPREVKNTAPVPATATSKGSASNTIQATDNILKTPTPKRATPPHRRIAPQSPKVSKGPSVERANNTDYVEHATKTTPTPAITQVANPRTAPPSTLSGESSFVDVAWQPPYLASLLNIQTEKMPNMSKMQTFKRSFLLEELAEQNWIPSFYHAPPAQKSMLPERGLFMYEASSEPMGPSSPGQHGCLLTPILRLPCDSDPEAPNQAAMEAAPLFVSSDKPGEYIYYGMYTFLRADRLDVFRCAALPASLKQYWARQLSDPKRPGWVTDTLTHHLSAPPVYSGPLNPDTSREEMEAHVREMETWSRDTHMKASFLKAENMQCVFEAPDAGGDVPGIRFWCLGLQCERWDHEFYDTLVRDQKEWVKGTKHRQLKKAQRERAEQMWQSVNPPKEKPVKW